MKKRKSLKEFILAVLVAILLLCLLRLPLIILFFAHLFGGDDTNDPLPDKESRQIVCSCELSCRPFGI